MSAKNSHENVPLLILFVVLGSESITYHSGTDHITIEPPGMEFSTICAYAKVVLISFTNVSDTGPLGSANLRLRQGNFNQGCGSGSGFNRVSGSSVEPPLGRPRDR
jgi:hypothetical protein